MKNLAYQKELIEIKGICFSKSIENLSGNKGIEKLKLN